VRGALGIRQQKFDSGADEFPPRVAEHLHRTPVCQHDAASHVDGNDGLSRGFEQCQHHLLLVERTQQFLIGEIRLYLGRLLVFHVPPSAITMLLL
jgi:hypothetical protein